MPVKNNSMFHAIVVLLTFVSVSHTSVPRRDERPNIIFLLADDLRKDALGCMGNPIIKTPNIDMLSAKGTMFTNAYVTTSICAISRASIFSGQYSVRHGIHNFRTGFSDSALRYTYPAMLKGSGYYTGFVGKYGVGLQIPAKDFNYSKGLAGPGYFHKNDKGDSIHSTDLMGNQVIEFLDTYDNTKPFCLSVSFKAPHALDGSPIHNGFIYGNQYESYYKNQNMPFPKTGDDKFYLSFPEKFRTSSTGISNEGRKRWEPRFSTPDKYQETVKSYYRLISGIDAVVGKLYQKLKEKGLSNNTIIIFTSDNGFYLGEHGLADKWYGHEESIRVPLIFFDPRLSEKERIPRLKEIALNIDLAPTILDYAGIKTPAAMQGKSLRPLMNGNNAGWRKEFYYDHVFPAPGIYIPKSEGLVARDYKYIRYYERDNPDDFFYEELFNTTSDVSEIANLANDRTKDNLKKAMIRKMKQMRSAMKMIY